MDKSSFGSGVQAAAVCLLLFFHGNDADQRILGSYYGANLFYSVCGDDGGFEQVMKLRMSKCLVRRLAFIQLDVAVAIVILMLVFIPLTVTSSSKLDLARRHHVEAVVLQLIDGEIDVLLAGEQEKYNFGEHRITPAGEAAEDLPKGEFILTLKEKQLSLAWVPVKLAKWGRIERAVNLK